MLSTHIVIIEDEKPAARSLQRQLKTMGYSHIQLLHSVSQAKAWFSEHAEPDILFLDIQLSDGLSFEILEAFPIACPIIFTTAYDEFALKAFKHNSVDYLMKPVLPQELQSALEKYHRNFDQNKQQIDLSSFKAFLSRNTNSYKTRFTFKVGQQLKLISIEEIESFYAANKGTYCYGKSGENYLIDYTLDQLEKQLDPELFFRINRGYIVQHRGIKSIAIHSNSRLRIIFNHNPASDAIVSRERVQAFKSWLA